MLCTRGGGGVMMTRWVISRFHYITRASCSSSSASSRSCWSCGQPLDASMGICLFCANESCGKIQALPLETDYFDLLGMEHGKGGFLSMSASDMESNYKSLQKRLHPDLFSTKSLQEQENSAANSTLVNRAYQCLRSDVKRASYILSNYHDIDVLSENSGSYHDDALNLEIFTLREEIDELNPEDTAEVKALRESLQETLHGIQRALHDAILSKDSHTMARQAIKMQYWRKMIQEMEDL